MSQQTPSLPRVDCPACGAPVELGRSFCESCGADLAMAAAHPRRRLVVPWGGLITLALVGAALTLGWHRLRAVGPGPDLSTTLRWVLHGDGERRPTLATLMRAYETARAVARCCLDTGEACPLAPPHWAKIAGYSNAAWRGFVPLVQWAAASTAIVGPLAHLLAVDGTDGWGRPWHAALEPTGAAERPGGFYPGALQSGSPPPAGRRLWHLTLRSAGADGKGGTEDDLVFEAVFPAPGPLRLGDPVAHRDREVELERGQVWVRWQGTELDLVDGRILAEFYLEGFAPF